MEHVSPCELRPQQALAPTQRQAPCRCCGARARAITAAVPTREPPAAGRILRHASACQPSAALPHAHAQVLGESYLRGILRPPLADVRALPPNPPHPFQKDMMFYLRQRFFKHHTPLVFGFAVAIWAFSKADQGMAGAKKKAYDEAIAEGRSPCGWPRAVSRIGGAVAGLPGALAVR